MAYIAKADFSRLISITLLDEILTQAVDTSGVTAQVALDNSLEMAIGQMTGYLKKQFDTDAELALTTGRNANFMRIALHLAIYYLHYTINPHDIPEMRRKAYEDALAELKKVQDGVIEWGLDPAPVEDVDGDGEPDPTSAYGRVAITSQRKFVSKPFTDPYLNGPDK